MTLCDQPPGPRVTWLSALVLFATIVALALLSGCAGKTALPPSAPEAVQVLVPVTKPCEVAQVDPSPLPSAGGVPNDIFEAVKRVLADRAVLLGDREALVAANTDPCPELKP